MYTVHKSTVLLTKGFRWLTEQCTHVLLIKLEDRGMLGWEYNCVCVTLEPVYSLYVVIVVYINQPPKVRRGLYATTILFGRKHVEVNLQTLIGLLCTADLIG